MPPSVMARMAAALVAVGLLLFIDLGTKSWAANDLRARGPRTIAGGHLRLQYSENTGIAFGRLRDGARQSAIVAYSAVSSLALFGVLLHRLLRKLRPGFALPVGCLSLLAGTLGNLHDRLERGYVIDFIALPRVTWAFNIADVYLSVGLILCGGGLLAAAVRHRAAALA